MIKPKVSVCMITYSHENYIREAIEGVLMQECDFEVELIIANDCSPDKTDEAIQEILRQHPRASRIRYIKQERNLGMIANFIFAMQECKGKYIALCEGDDYWTDTLKLQKQVDFLETNPEYVLCFHKVDILKTSGEIVDDFITKVPENYETIETLARLGNYIHTPSVVFRNIIKRFPFEFNYTPIGDYFLYIMLAEHGKLNYLEEKMCVYRYGVGVFSGKSSIHITKSNLKLYTCLASYLNDENIKKIIFLRYLNCMNLFENKIENQLKFFFISDHVLFKKMKFIKHNYKQPSIILNKIIVKLFK